MGYTYRGIRTEAWIKAHAALERHSEELKKAPIQPRNEKPAPRPLRRIDPTQTLYGGYHALLSAADEITAHDKLKRNTRRSR